MRAWSTPSAGNSILVVGDMHFGGSNGGTSNVAGRNLKVQRDILTGNLPRVPVIQVGDLVEEPLTAQDDEAVAFMDAITDTGIDLYATLGNHDFAGAGIGNTRTQAEAVTALGIEALNYTVDLGFVQLIFVGDCASHGQMSQDALDWLEDELAAATKDCWIVCHDPLYNTVLGDVADVYSSVEDFFHLTGPNRANLIDDSEIRVVLNASSRAKAIIGGHTHSPVSTTGFADTKHMGVRLIASINASATIYTGRTKEIGDPLLILCLTREEDGSVTVRFRDCGAGVWRPDLTTNIVPS